jgi:hypothetical protein
VQPGLDNIRLQADDIRQLGFLSDLISSRRTSYHATRGPYRLLR